jgi:hypothetical protein
MKGVYFKIFIQLTMVSSFQRTFTKTGSLLTCTVFTAAFHRVTIVPQDTAVVIGVPPVYPQKQRNSTIRILELGIPSKQRVT